MPHMTWRDVHSKLNIHTHNSKLCASIYHHCRIAPRRECVHVHECVIGHFEWRTQAFSKPFERTFHQTTLATSVAAAAAAMSSSHCIARYLPAEFPSLTEDANGATVVNVTLARVPMYTFSILTGELYLLADVSAWCNVLLHCQPSKR